MTVDPRYDVLFVEQADLAALPTEADPMASLRKQVPSPFWDWDTTIHNNTAVAVTVVSLLDEPVEGVGVYTPAGSLVGMPQVRTGGEIVRAPSLEHELSGHTGYGWIDPAGFDDLVSVGSWIARNDGFRGVSVVVHLRCTDSKVDLLVGGRSAYRLLPGAHLGGYNPYNVRLYEPGQLPAGPQDSDYDDFFNTYVDGQGTVDDQEGTSTTAPVSFLARAPQGRQDTFWHILLVLGPHPIKAGWPDEATRKAATDAAAQRAQRLADAVERLLAVNAALDPDETAETRIDAVVSSVPSDERLAVLGEYQRTLLDVADAVTKLLAASEDLDPDAAARERILQVTGEIPLRLIDYALSEYQRRLQAVASGRQDHPDGSRS